MLNLRKSIICFIMKIKSWTKWFANWGIKSLFWANRSLLLMKNRRFMKLTSRKRKDSCSCLRKISITSGLSRKSSGIRKKRCRRFMNRLAANIDSWNNPMILIHKNYRGRKTSYKTSLSWEDTRVNKSYRLSLRKTTYTSRSSSYEMSWIREMHRLLTLESHLRNIRKRRWWLSLNCIEWKVRMKSWRERFNLARVRWIRYTSSWKNYKGKTINIGRCIRIGWRGRQVMGIRRIRWERWKRFIVWFGNIRKGLIYDKGSFKNLLYISWM